MNKYLADLHIHTALSPCGNNDMTPGAIVEKAIRKGLQIIAITDHNTTLQWDVTRELGEEKGLLVLGGAEVTTGEGIHCLCLFDNKQSVAKFQEYLDRHVRRIPYDSSHYGEQLLYDRYGNVIRKEHDFLAQPIAQTITQVEATTHALNGIFIPSHINRPHNSLLSLFNEIPEGLTVDALEIDNKYTEAFPLENYPFLHSYPLISNSDAHHLEGIGMFPSYLEMENLSFAMIKKAFLSMRVFPQKT